MVQSPQNRVEEALGTSRNSRLRTLVSRFRWSNALPLGTFGAVLGLGTLFAGLTYHPAASQEDASATTYAGVVQGYCVVCHNGELKTAGLELDKANVVNPSADAEVWEKVIRKLRIGAMPPQGMPRPDK